MSEHDQDYLEDIEDGEEDESLTLDSLLAEFEEAAAAEAEESGAEELAEQAEHDSEVAGRMAKRVNQGLWLMLARFFPATGEAVGEVYGASGGDGLADRIKQGEIDIQRLMEHYNFAPKTLDKIINHPAVGAGVYVGMSVYGAFQAQRLHEMQQAIEQQAAAEGGEGGEEQEP